MLTEQDLIQNNIFEYLYELNLDINSYVIIGSGVMYALELKDLSKLRDLDILVNDSTWSKIKNLGKVETGLIEDLEKIQFLDGQLEVIHSITSGGNDLDYTIKSGLKIGRFKFASVEQVIKWKRIRGLEKDLQHIKLLEEFLSSKR